MQLYNKLSAEERKILIEKAETKRLTLSFYRYYKIKNPRLFRDYLFINFSKIDILGRIYIAEEGVNAQLSLPAIEFENFKKFLDQVDFLKRVRLNIGISHNNHSFLKLKIKIRDKIVADGLTDKNLDLKDSGIHVGAKKFNELLFDRNTICVDMRNHYESEIGYFQGAIRPDVDTFRDSLPLVESNLKKHKKHKNILMYCTGGIRCEKASAYLKKRGFSNVFQLEGGIIEYSRQVKKNGLKNFFKGKNFVFDQRRSERISD